MLEIKLFGQFDIQLDGKRINLPSRQAQSLLAYLLLNPDLQHRREKLAGLLWPDKDESTARRRLRYAIWEIRKAIGEDFLIADRIIVSLNNDWECALDVSILDRTMSPSISTDDLIQTVSVYEGDLLPGFYEDWITLERERLEASFESRIKLLLHRLIDEKRWSEVLQWGEQWIALGQSPEPAFRALMISHCQLGENSKAISTYQRCVQNLHDLIGVEPSAETKTMYEQIVAGEKPEQLPYEPIDQAPYDHIDFVPPYWDEVKAAWPEEKENVFVAREYELDKLQDKLEIVLSGQGQVVFIRGDAGMGKTALIQEFSRRVLQSNDEVIAAYGRSEAQTGLGDPHLPFRDILANLSGDVESKWIKSGFSQQGAMRLWYLFPKSTRALIELGPDLVGTFVSGNSILDHAARFKRDQSNWFAWLEENLSQLQSKPVPLNIQHSDTQKDLFNQYTKVLQRIAQDHPLMIILDDLQWADIGSISLLFHLGRRITMDRILLVGIYRLDEITQTQDQVQHPLISVLAELKRTFGDNEIDLAQLDEAEGRGFVECFLDTEPNKLSTNFRRAIFDHTGGHPLFTIELLHQMQSQGDLQKDEEGYWVEGPSIKWDSLPPKVEAVIEGRIDRLSNQLKEILNIASVEGEEFTAEVIACVTGIEISQTILKLSTELDKNDLLVEARGTQRIGEQRLSRYVFRHHLFQKYVYDSLDKVEMVHLHEKVGNALETLYKDQANQIAVRLARHFEEAGLSTKAIDYLLQAGNQAKRSSANEEAISHFSRGFEILQNQADIKDRFRRELDLQIAMSAPLVATKGYTAPEAERTFERARELCERIDDKQQLGTALWGLWSFYLVRAKYTIARELAEQILSHARSSEDSNLLLIANWTLGITLVHLGEFKNAQKHLDEAIELYHPISHQSLTYLYGQNPAVTCMSYSAVTLWMLGFPDQARDRLKSAMQLAEEISHPYSQAFAYGMASVLHAQQKDAETSLQFADNTFALSKEEGFPYLMALGMTTRGWARSELGKTSMTSRLIQRGIDGMEKIGAELARPQFLYLLAETYRKNGQIEDGLVILEEAIDIACTNGEYLNQSDLYRLKGVLMKLKDEEENKVLECIYRAIETAQQRNAKLQELRAIKQLYQYQLEHGLPVDSKKDLVEIYGWFTEGLDTADLVEAHDLIENDNESSIIDASL